MKFLSSKIGILSLVFLTGIVITIGFQNCAKTQFSTAKPSENITSSGTNFCVLNPSDPACTSVAPVTCTFNGQTIANGQSITAYLNSSGVCTSEKRVCTDGQLSGSFNYASCSPTALKACLFNGITIDSGRSVTAYLNSNAPAGSSCQSETRLCTDGVLSGSYSYGSCVVNDFAGCLFNGSTVAHGGTVIGYQNSTVPAGQTCTSEVRQCVNGDLTGTYNFASCTVNQPAACTFNGQTIASGQSVTAFLASTAEFGQTCTSETRTCNNGALSGSYTFASCNVNQPAACVFNGQTVANGQSVVAYLNGSVAFGATCTQESRVCNNGVLSGSYNYGNCSVTAAANCQFNGQTIAHGQSVPAFLNSTVAYGETCSTETRTCNNGALSGSYTYGSCSVGVAASCTFNGQTVANGATVTAFQSSSVAYGQSCVSETRSCSNGALSGSYTFASCNVNQPAACTFNGQTIAHGESVTSYASSSVAYGQTCSSQVRTCTNGTLSGSYSYGSCTVNQAASCSFNGQTIPNGSGVTAYAASSVAYGGACASQYRTCSNGTLSGSYGASSCVVQQAASCSFNGQTIPSGSGVTAYAAYSVAYGQACASQYRTCSNGTLSGSYGASNCAVQQAASCPTQQSGALYCGSRTLCPDGKEVTPSTVMSTTGTISGVANGQYSYVNSTSIGTATNIRYRCDNGTFIWDPSGATSCSAPNTYLPASDSRCKKNCTSGLSTVVKCLVREMCQNGKVISRTTQYPSGYFNITGTAGQTVGISSSQVSIPGYTVTRWDSYAATCDAGGNGNWTQGTTGEGYCEADKDTRVSNTDYRCQATYGDGA